MGETSFPETIGGRYRTIRPIGRGAMGVVYEVEHVHTGEHLALKVLVQSAHVDAIAGERFKREARASSRIKSDHVVRVTDADVAPELDGAPFLVMELLEGTDFDRVASDPPPPPEEVVDWLRQMARALDKAHEIGIIHRDLKPANVFLADGRDGGPAVVKILDFGLAKTVSGDEHVKTRPGQIMGTPMYMAPEQADPDGAPESPRSDLFSLGLIAFRLLTGHDYWIEGTVRQVLTQILVEPMPAASARGAAFGEAFDAWFARACAREIEQRFASAHEMVEALAAALGLPPVSRPATSASRPRASKPMSSLEAAVTSVETRSPARWRIAGIVALAGIALAWIAWPRARETTETTPPKASPSAEVSVSAAPPPIAPELPPSAIPSSSPSALPSAGHALPSPRPATTAKPRASASARPIDPLEGQH